MEAQMNELEIDAFTKKVPNFSENSETLTENIDPAIFFNGSYKVWLPINRKIDLSTGGNEPTLSQIVDAVREESRILDEIQGPFKSEF
jgi:hypothetical protein